MKKLTYDFVKASFEKEGYTLVSTEYTRSDSKLEYICDKGHLHFTTWENWKCGSRCPKCVGGVRLSFEEVKASFEKESYILLSTEYQNNTVKLQCECPQGHVYEVKYGNWVNGKRCPHCAGNARLTYEYVKAAFDEAGYVLLTSEYTNTDGRLDYICTKGHTHHTTWRHWSSGKRCYYCGGRVKPLYEYVQASFNNRGYTLLSTEYVNDQTKLEYICPIGHTHSITWNNWEHKNQGCPVCADIKMSGPGNPNWHLGASFQQYCEAWQDKEYKQDIRDRDQNKCLNPYCQSNNPTDLNIHHIDYDKKNCKPDNLITVCRSCNAKANIDRDWHQSWYRAILRNRYGYSY